MKKQRPEAFLAIIINKGFHGINALRKIVKSLSNVIKFLLLNNICRLPNKDGILMTKDHQDNKFKQLKTRDITQENVLNFEYTSLQSKGVFFFSHFPKYCVMSTIRQLQKYI